MALQEWLVRAKLTGDFYISNEHIKSESFLMEDLQRLMLSPEINKDGKWTGIHELEAVLLLDQEEYGLLPAHKIYERAKNIVDTVAAIATLGAGRPVCLTGSVSIRRRLANDQPKYRVIMCASSVASIPPSRPIPAGLLAMSIDPRIRRVIRWWARGLAASDVVDGLVAFNNALDLLVGMVDGAPKRVRECRTCGAKEIIGPGLRERVTHFLTCHQGYTPETATDLYESRNDLAHARSNLEVEELRRYRQHARLVADAVRAGIARFIGVTLPQSPELPSLDSSDAILDIEYVENATGQQPDDK